MFVTAKFRIKFGKKIPFNFSDVKQHYLHNYMAVCVVVLLKKKMRIKIMQQN